MSPSIPFNSPFMSLSFSRYVRFIFHVCPFLSLPVISLHLPLCSLVSLCFVCLSVPPHSPCYHFFPIHIPFSCPLLPFHFPLLSYHVDFLSPACPCIFLYFLPSFPCISLHVSFAPWYFSGKQSKKVLPTFSQTGCDKTQSFSRVSAKGGRKPPNQQRAGKARKIQAWDPCLATPAPRRLFFSGASSDYRAIRG